MVSINYRPTDMCKVYFDILKRLGMDHECDRQTGRYEPPRQQGNSREFVDADFPAEIPGNFCKTGGIPGNT